MRRMVVIAAGAVTLAWCAMAQEPAKVFKAGAATSNITPWLGSSLNGNMNDQIAQHVHDELHARCLVLDDGTARIAFAVVDSCMLPREVVDEAKRIASERTGIPVGHILVAATHSHSAGCATGLFQSDPDPEYQQFLSRRIADGIARAVNRLAPARIGHGVALLPSEVFNRRWHMKPGTVPPDPFGGTTDRVQMNPPRASENLLEPAGPTDPEISFISVQGLDGEPVALLANYSLHYVGGVGGGHVSADYFGMFAAQVARILGADDADSGFVAMMTNGTSGDINNINFREKGVAQQPYEQMGIVVNRAADAVVNALGSVSYEDGVPLRAAQEEIALGVRKPSAAEVAKAKEVLAAAQGRALQGLPEIYARETVLLDAYPDTVPVSLQAIGIGELGIAAIPCEVFVEIGLKLKKESPLGRTFTIELANGYNGYLPTAEHHALGGYETWRARSSYLEVGAAERITATVLALLAKVHGS